MLEGRNHGLLDTYMVTPDGRYTLVADSAASATQIACGVFSIPQVTGLDQQGYPCQTALEYAKGLGMATGLVTDARITHATPGAFVAKQVSRSAENLPVLVMAAGPHGLARQVRGYNHTTDIGLLLFEALGRE